MRPKVVNVVRSSKRGGHQVIHFIRGRIIPVDAVFSEYPLAEPYGHGFIPDIGPRAYRSLIRQNRGAWR